MLGKRFKLERATVAIQYIDGKRRVVIIPVGEIFKVVSEPNQEGLVNVNRDSQIFEMFAVDVEARGTEMKDPESEGHRESSRSATSS